MRCDAVRRRMSRYLDDGLGAAERAGMARHLKVCRVCDMELKEHLRMRDLLRGAGEAVPPMADDGETFWLEVRQRMARPVVIRPALWLRKAAPVAVAASLALVALVGFPRADSSSGERVAKAPLPPAESASVASVPAEPAPAVASAEPASPSAESLPSREEPVGSSALRVGLVGAGGGSASGSAATRPSAKPLEPEMIWF